MMAGDALQRSVARFLIVRSRGPRGGAPRVRRRLYRLHAFLVHGAVTLHAPAHGELGSRHGHGGQIHQIVADVLPRLGVHLFHIAARLDELFGLAETIRDTEHRQADQIRAGRSLREQVSFKQYLERRAADPSLTFRQHLRAVRGAIEE